MALWEQPRTKHFSSGAETAPVSPFLLANTHCDLLNCNWSTFSEICDHDFDIFECGYDAGDCIDLTSTQRSSRIALLNFGESNHGEYDTQTRLRLQSRRLHRLQCEVRSNLSWNCSAWHSSKIGDSHRDNDNFDSHNILECDYDEEDCCTAFNAVYPKCHTRLDDASLWRS